MKIGTKSVLYGAHAFWLHPFCVAAAWWKLYGFPCDPRLWFAFFLHDIGYVGKPNMDGPEGEEHPRLGAAIMGFLFDWGMRDVWQCSHCGDLNCSLFHSWNGKWQHEMVKVPRTKWHDFTLLHSRHFAKKYGMQPSPLCVADKYVPCLMPSWLYLPMVRWTGEIDEYMANGYKAAMNDSTPFTQEEREWFLLGGKFKDSWMWFKGLQSYMARWVEAHKDGEADTWTKVQTAA